MGKISISLEASRLFQGMALTPGHSGPEPTTQGLYHTSSIDVDIWRVQVRFSLVDLHRLIDSRLNCRTVEPLASIVLREWRFDVIAIVWYSGHPGMD